MPRGDKSDYTDKQKRQAEHIEQGYRDKGVSSKEAEARAWATVNKEDGGGKKSGAARKTAKKKTPRKTATKKTAARKSPAKSAKKRTATRGRASAK